MATRKPVNPMRIRLRTKTAGMDYDGSIAEGIEMSFFHLPAKERQELIAKLQEAHQSMLLRESKLPIP